MRGESVYTSRRQFVRLSAGAGISALAGCSGLFSVSNAPTSGEPLIRALSATDGSKRWSVTLDQTVLGALIDPVIRHNRIYLVSESSFETERSKIKALSTEDGTVEWSLDVQWSENLALTAGTDNLFALTAGNKLRAIDLTAGTEQWSRELPPARSEDNSTERHPAQIKLARGGTAFDNVYVGIPGEDANLFYGFDIADGSKEWQLTIPVSPETSLFGYVPLFEFGPHIVLRDETLYSRGQGKLVAINLRDEQIRWTYTQVDKEVSAPTISSDKLYITENENVIALDRQTGIELWTREIEIDHFPRVSSGTVISVGRGGDIRALSATDGSIRWTFNSRETPVSLPTVDSKTVYMGITDPPVFGSIVKEFGLSPDSGHAYAVDATDGSIRWRTPIRDTVYIRTILYNDMLYLFTQN